MVANLLRRNMKSMQRYIWNSVEMTVSQNGKPESIKKEHFHENLAVKS